MYLEQVALVLIWKISRPPEMFKGFVSIKRTKCKALLDDSGFRVGVGNGSSAGKSREANGEEGDELHGERGFR